MLWALAQPDDVGQQVPEMRRTIQDTDHERDAVFRVQGTVQQPALHHDLKADVRRVGMAVAL
jgi:hypothetical protein